MIMDEIIWRITEENRLPEIMVYTDDIVIWEPKESTLEKKFQKTVTVWKDFGLKVSLDKCVVMKKSQRQGGGGGGNKI
jgi:hypothetical protein